MARAMAVPRGYTDRRSQWLRAPFSKEHRTEHCREERACDQWQDVEDAEVQQLFRLTTQPERREGQPPGRGPDERSRETAPVRRRAPHRDDE